MMLINFGIPVNTWLPRVTHLRRVWVVVVLGAGLGSTLSSCSGSNSNTSDVPPEPSFRIGIMTDLKGYLEPCGCTSHPLGGIDRLAHKARTLRQQGPLLLVAAGSTLFHGAPPKDITHDTQERWRAETVARALRELNVSAVTPGPTDFLRGVSLFQKLASTSDAAWLAGNAAPAPLSASPPTSPPDLTSTRVTKVKTREGETVKVGIFGVSDLRDADGSAPEGLAIQPRSSLAQTAKKLAAELTRKGANLRIALVSGSRADAKAVARASAVDFVVQAGLDRAEALPPERSGSSWLLHAGRQGQGLVVVDIWVPAVASWTKGRRFTDRSTWSRESAVESLRVERDELAERIKKWKRSGFRAEDIAAQAARLKRIDQQIASRKTLPPWSGGLAFAATWNTFGPKAPSHAGMRKRVEAHHRRVNQHNKRALAGQTPPAPAPGQPSYVGSQTCGNCHAPALAWWKRTPHGRAYNTLVTRHKEYNLNCVGCHVTGYRRPGGSTATHLLGGALRNVGCENCHGPGSNHVAAPSLDNIERDAAESTCRGCHNPEHSDRFHYDTYRRLLIMPGHGQPPKGAS